MTKFNRLAPAEYGTFIDVGCQDLLPSAAKGRPGAISHRIGFTAMPLACLVGALAAPRTRGRA